MANLKTRYLGLELGNPFVAGASGLTARMDTIRRLEDAGAAALVCSSLFEEQIQLESFVLQEELHRYDNRHAEMLDLFPDIEHSGPDEHLMWVRRAKEAVSIPVIASLNAVNQETWVRYAGLLAETGADALELNFYATPDSLERSGAEIEAEQVEIVREIRAGVSLPLSVKLSASYANPLAQVRALEEAGADGFVLFNRFLQPDIDVEAERNVLRHVLSTQADQGPALRYTGLLAGRIRGDICAGSGIMQAADAVKMLLAGAACVQVVSSLYKEKVSHLSTLKRDLAAWMEKKNYAGLTDFRGKLCAANNPDPWAFRRAQYVRLLMGRDQVLKSYPAP